MSKTESTIAKFHACTGIKKDLLTEWINIPVQGDDEIDLGHFNKILIKNDMEEYSTLLFHYFLWQRKYIKSEESLNNSMNKVYDEVDKHINLKKDLTEILSFLLSEEKGSLLSLTFKKQKGSKSISNNVIIQSISNSVIELVIDKLIEIFKEQGYNIETLTEEEAEIEIRKNPDVKWITEWKIRKAYYDSEDNRIYDNDFEEHKDYFNYETGEYHSGSYIKNQMINDYAESHFTRRNIDLDYLNNLKAEGLVRKKKPGAHEKDKYVKPILKSLVDLIRVDRLLNSENKINDIEKVDLKDKDCRFIYDCFYFWKLFDDQKQGKKITSPPDNYIRTKLKQIKKPINPKTYDRIRIAKFTALRYQISSNQFK